MIASFSNHLVSLFWPRSQPLTGVATSLDATWECYLVGGVEIAICSPPQGTTDEGCDLFWLHEPVSISFIYSSITHIMQHHINQLSAISATAIWQPALQQDWTTHLSAITATAISHQPATTAAEKDREWQTQLAPEFYVDGASTALRSEFIQQNAREGAFPCNVKNLFF